MDEASPAPGSSGPASLLSSVGREVVGVQVVVGSACRQAVVSVQEALDLLDRLQAVTRRVRVRLERAGGRRVQGSRLEKVLNKTK